MDRQLAERMVGAACLLAVLVLVVPAILDGNPDSGATITHPPAEASLDLRTHTIRLDRTERESPVPALVQVPGSPDPAPLALPEPPPLTPDNVTSDAAASEAIPPKPVLPEQVRPLAQEALPGGGEWFVQLGSFSQRENSDRLVAQLEGKGFSASVLGGGGVSGTLFRVRAGPEGDRASAEALAERLGAAGFKGGRVGRQ